MPRRTRVFIPGVPMHLVARGHSRRNIVLDQDDRARFLSLMRHASATCRLAVHAWVLMTNHLHLLATPEQADSLPEAMGWLGARYGRYFNKRHGRSGALWEGRYKPSFVHAQRYLFHCYRYIELNPVRAGMVKHPAEYAWSSHGANAWGIPDGLVTPHALYSQLAPESEERLAAYRALFGEQLDGEIVARIRRAARRGHAVGDQKFLDMVGKRVRDKE